MAEAIPRDEMDMLAAEYVIGLLDGAQRREVSALIDRDGTMRLLVDLWQDRCAGMNAEYAAVPTPNVWPALNKQLFGVQRRRNIWFWSIVAGLAVALVAKVAFWAGLLL